MSSKHLEDPDDDLLDADEAAEEIPQGEDEDMDSGDDNMDPDAEVLILQNDSIAYFDLPQDSLFTIAQHPTHPSLVAVGGSAGQEDDAPGAGWLFDTSAAQSRPVLPASYASDPSSAQTAKTTQLESLFALEGHTDSLNTLCWTLPKGEVLVSGGLDGRLRTWTAKVQPGTGVKMEFLGEAQEVPEVNWLLPCPSTDHPNTVALGASDGSVWVYTIDASDKSNPLQIVQSYFLHTASCTAGSWTPDGQLLVTISEDSSLYAWDVWGLAASQSLVDANGQTAMSLTGEDQRFGVEGGLYSIAIDPNGTFVVVGGAGGAVRVVSLPRLSSATQSKSQARGRGAAGKTSNDPSTGGQILASLKTQSDSIEAIATTIAPTTPPTTLVATGSVDGSICVYDATRRFAVRRNLVGAHEDHSVVKLEFVPNTWQLTSCGMDGVVRRWDTRGGAGAGVTGSSGATASSQVGSGGGGSVDAGLLKEWKGHRGGGEGGGILGFVQGETGERVVTAGDDGIALVFEA